MTFNKRDSQRQSRLDKRANRITDQTAQLRAAKILLGGSGSLEHQGILHIILGKCREELNSLVALQVKERGVVRSIINTRRKSSNKLAG